MFPSSDPSSLNSRLRRITPASDFPTKTGVLKAGGGKEIRIFCSQLTALLFVYDVCVFCVLFAYNKMFCFDDPPKLQLPFQTSQQINRSPTGEKWAKRHSEPTHPPDMPTRNLPSLLQIPVPGRSLVQPKHVMHMKQKLLGPFLVYLDFFWLHPKLSNQW